MHGLWYQHLSYTHQVSEGQNRDSKISAVQQNWFQCQDLEMTRERYLLSKNTIKGFKLSYICVLKKDIRLKKIILCETTINFLISVMSGASKTFQFLSHTTQLVASAPKLHTLSVGRAKQQL